MEINGKLYCSRCMCVIETQAEFCPFCGYTGHEERSPSFLEEGTLLNDKYQLGAVIGQGGFGITYAAWDENLARPVAIKEYFPSACVTRNIDLSDEVSYVESARDAFLEGRLRFSRESHLLAQLQEIPNVVRVLDSFEENETAYIVMEYIHGVPLDAWMQSQKMKPGQILDALRPVADALTLLHKQGVVHRDLKPDNMLVEADGTIRLIDFGAAMRLEKHSETVILSRGFAPAEQYGKEYGRQGPWSDVYGLAAVLYFLLTGKVPDEAILRKNQDHLKSPAELGVRIGKKQNAALMAGLAVDPEKRTQSMEEFRARLYDLPLPEEVLWRRRMRRRMLGVSAAVIALLLLVFVNFFVGFPLGQRLLYSLRGDGWHVLREIGSQQRCVVPASRLGIPVTAVVNGAFRDDQNLIDISLPDSVHSIGDMAFEGCSSLKNVSLTSGVSHIGVNAFKDVSANMVICGKKSSYADQYAREQGLYFTDCSTMTFEPVEGGLALTAIEREQRAPMEFEQFLATFGDKPNWEVLVIPSYVDGIPVVEIKDGVQITLVQTLVLPEQLRRVPDGLCDLNWHLESIIFGRMTEEIGERAFSGASPLKTLELPEHLRRIGANAFSGCDNLNDIQWPETLIEIGKSAFEDCKSLESAELPETLTTIGERAFADCESLEKVVLPESVREIGESAFYSCDNLKTAIISGGIERIPNHCFSYCSQLTNVELPESLTEIGNSAFSNTAIKTIRLPQALQSIGESAFYHNSDLEYIFIPEQVSSIEGGCFSDCKSLKWLMFESDKISVAETAISYFPDLVIGGRTGSVAETLAKDNNYPFENVDLWSTDVTLKGNVADLDSAEGDIIVPWYNKEDNCLITDIENAKNITSIRLSHFQREIAESAFCDCSNLTDVVCTSQITSIGAGAFKNCSALTRMPHFEGLINIGAGAFYGCTAMKTIDFPEGLLYIDSRAFDRCSALTSVRLPSSLRGMEWFAFANTGLRFVYISGSLNTTSNIFVDCGFLETALVGNNIKSLDWNSFGDAVQKVILSPSVQTISLIALPADGALKDLWIYNPDCKSELDLNYQFSVEYTPPGALDLFLPEDTVIHGYPGSTAEELAKNRGYAFQPIDIPYEELAEQYLKLYEE